MPDENVIGFFNQKVKKDDKVMEILWTSSLSFEALAKTLS